jgi:hypothetical protein
MTEPSPTIPELPPKAVKKATNLVTDSRLALVVGLIPLLGLVYILRLVQWYLLRRQFPLLREANVGRHTELAAQFRGALGRLWLAVLLWPIAIGLVLLYVMVDLALHHK